MPLGVFCVRFEVMLFAEGVAVEQPAEKWFFDRTLTISAQAAPVPALHYRLLPAFLEYKEGNAVPIYLRLAQERDLVSKDSLSEKVEAWNKVPLKKIPRKEAKARLNELQHILRQMELAARRRTADWNFPLDLDGPPDLLLPQIHMQRVFSQLVALQARVELAEAKFPQAVHTVQTGFSYSRQMNEAPFFASSLVAIATATLFTNCVFDFVELPGAPNLYWALSDLPQPLIDLRRSTELEQWFWERHFPELRDLDRHRSAQEWAATLRQFRKNREQVTELDKLLGTKYEPPPGTASTDPAENSPDLPLAKQYLVDVARLPEEGVRAMPAAQILLFFIAKQFREYRDDCFKSARLAYPQARRLLKESNERRSKAPATEGRRLADSLLPTAESMLSAQMRLERRLTLARVLEAFRLNLASNNGQLPNTLDDVKVVPVPLDPATLQPFEYKRERTTAVLMAPPLNDTSETDGFRIRITVRK